MEWMGNDQGLEIIFQIFIQYLFHIQTNEIKLKFSIASLHIRHDSIFLFNKQVNKVRHSHFTQHFHVYMDQKSRLI